MTLAPLLVVKVLVVDDCQENLVALEALLGRNGLEILLAHSADEALGLLQIHEVALCLLDVQMPGVDGYTMAEKMKGTDRTSHIPIIFITAGRTDRASVERGYAVGAVDFLYKPIDTKILRQKVDWFVELYRQRQSVADCLHLNETFVASVAHDLLTPLNVMMMSAGMIRDDTNEPATRRAAERMMNSGKRMSAMIDDLFDLARVRLGSGIQLEKYSCDFATIVRRGVQEFETTDPTRSVEVHIAGDTTGQWDEKRCEQIVANLVANALHHGARNVAVRVDLEGREDEIVFCVSNGGLILAEELPHLFDPFRTTGHSRPGNHGLGLGLYIVQQVTAAHGGSVTVESSQTSGTSFTVKLPRGKS